MTNKFIGRQEHTSTFYGFIRQNDGTLMYVKSNDDDISINKTCMLLYVSVCLQLHSL
jgi:hypothetical protein